MTEMMKHNEERQGVSRGFFWVRSCCLAKWHIHLASSKI